MTTPELATALRKLKSFEDMMETIEPYLPKCSPDIPPAKGRWVSGDWKNDAERMEALK